MTINTKAATGSNGAAPKNQSAGQRVGLTKASLTQPLAHLIEKVVTYQTCTSCAQSAQQLALRGRLRHLGSPVEVDRLCFQCSNKHAGGISPRPSLICPSTVFVLLGEGLVNA